MKTRIRYFQNIFWVDDKPLPPGLVVREEAELVLRLRSTRGGNNARWEVGEKAREALNGAPFEPMLRAVVKDFVWYPPDTRDCPARLDTNAPHEDEVRQSGSAVPNWQATVVRPLEDPLRPLIERVWAAIAPPGGAPVARQGRLELYGLGEAFLAEDADRVPHGGSGNKRFFNHYVLGTRQWIWRVPRGTRQAVAVACLRDQAWILSPDHPDQPLQLEEGWYALVHPLPESRRGVD